MGLGIRDWGLDSREADVPLVQADGFRYRALRRRVSILHTDVIRANDLTHSSRVNVQGGLLRRESTLLP